jgi:hypothetical protein
MANDDDNLNGPDDLPEDPFERDIPEFQLEGPYADEILSFVHKFANAKLDYSALLHQQSFRELANAVWALTDEQARTVLLRAITTSIAIHMNDPERFSAWVEKQ